MSRLGDALRPAVTRAAQETLKLLRAGRTGRAYPVVGVAAFFEVSDGLVPGRSGRPKDGLWTVRARGMLPDDGSSSDWAASSFSAANGEIPILFSALIERAVLEGPNRLAEAWEENMLRMIDAGVTVDDLRASVTEALARLVMES